MEIDIEEVLKCAPCQGVYEREDKKTLRIGWYHTGDKAAIHLFDERYKASYRDIRLLTVQELFFLQIHWS